MMLVLAFTVLTASAFLYVGQSVAQRVDEASRIRSLQLPPSAAEMRTYGGLHAAAAQGDVIAVSRLAVAGADPNGPDGHGRTPLHLAVLAGDRETTRALLAAGADPNARDRLRYDALTIAAISGDNEMLRILIAGGADARGVTGPNATSALNAAAQLGHVAVVGELIGAGAAVDHADAQGATALIDAVSAGDGGPAYVETVKALVAAGADIERPDGRGITALAYAERLGYRAIADVLKANGGR